MQQSGLYRAPAPVEGKGYKSMINLPDWSNILPVVAEPGNQSGNDGIRHHDGCADNEV
jgi:hypothetical protein